MPARVSEPAIIQETGEMTEICTEITESSTPADYDYRELHLLGSWRHRDCCECKLRAVLRVQADSNAEGPVHWTSIRAHGHPCGYTGIESVRGYVKGRHVEVEGYETAPNFQLDCYMIHLAGEGQAGQFHGMSRAYGDWDGRMEGTYQFINHRR